MKKLILTLTALIMVSGGSAFASSCSSCEGGKKEAPKKEQSCDKEKSCDKDKSEKKEDSAKKS